MTRKMGRTWRILTLVAWLTMVLILAAATTYLAVKITPDRSKPEDSDS